MIVAERVEPATAVPVGDRGDAAILGLGAVAVALVLAAAFRVPGIAGGWIGLELAFVIAGFVSTRSLVRRMGSERRWMLRHLRDVVAVVGPATLTATVFALGWTYVQDGELTGPVKGAAAATVGQVYDLVAVFGTVDQRAFGAWWPIGMAVQLALVAIVVVLAVRRLPSRRAAGVVLGLVVVGLVVRTFFIAGGGAPTSAVRLPWLHGDGFLVGVAVALVHRRLVVVERQRLFRATGPALVILVAGAVLLSATIWDESSVLVLTPVLAILSGVVVLGLASRSASPGLLATLGSRPVVWLGRRSLTIFLWHHPVGVMLVAGGDDRWDGPGLLARQLGLTLVLALAAYEFVDRPLAARLHPTPNRP